MPELPEVETIRRSLLPLVAGGLIRAIQTDTPGVLINAGLTTSGWQIRDLSRRGKYLLVTLWQEETPVQRALLIVHLRMTGRLTVQAEGATVRRHTHVRILIVPDGAGAPFWLHFQDTRRFGRLWLVSADQPETWPTGLVRLGPEPLEPTFTSHILQDNLQRHARLSIKAALLDQRIVAGLGNIYADESLFAAGLAPVRPAGSLQSDDIVRLTEAIRHTLARAIDCCGTTLRDYVDGWSRAGSFQECLMVYGRAGQPCRHCDQMIRQRKLAGRTTAWCPECQK
jgi:formamidopyrimidine-DNA glycosylase